MLILDTEIAKAKSRADFDLARTKTFLRDKAPGDIDTAQYKSARRTFLRNSNTPVNVEQAYERVLQGNELQPINYLERGSIAAEAIARIDVGSPSGAQTAWATGFLIAPEVLITNRHVFPDEATAASSQAHFFYEIGLDDQPKGPVIFEFDTAKLFYVNEALDFAIAAVKNVSPDGKSRLAEFGCLPLLDVPGKALEGEWLTIVQHPSGERKQICVRENQLIKRADDVVWYSTDTLPGSSGSPVFNNDWYVVALHHSGVPEEHDGEIQTVDGRPYDPNTTEELQIKWIANEGIRASRIVQTLKADLPQHPLLKPLFSATPASARVLARPTVAADLLTPSFKKEAKTMADNRSTIIPIEIRLHVQCDGGTVSATAVPSVSAEAAPVSVQEKSSKPAARFDAPFDDDYSKRNGYNPDFLGNGNKRVGLPVLSAGLLADAVPLVAPAQGHVLNYQNYSVVMHKDRRLAIFSAANVSFGGRFDMSRPPDVWRRDPRIAPKYQIENWYYTNNNFDRGHLTRREDMEYGKTAKAALQCAADTCHWTNCTPQHAQFNQNKEIWQGIERYILETSIMNGHINAQIITGPVLDEGDPQYNQIQYPVEFWKVVAALDESGALFATAYLASQADVIAKYGIEAAPFGAYKTFQVKISEIERITGLKFVCGATDATPLKNHDPLDVNPPKRRRSTGPAPDEAAPVSGGYREIRSLEDIHFKL